jgi:hypothetical protein
LFRPPRDAVTLCVVCRLSDSGFQSPSPQADLPFRFLIWIDIYHTWICPRVALRSPFQKTVSKDVKAFHVVHPPHEASRADPNPLQAAFGLSLSSGVCGISDTDIIVRTPISFEFRVVSPLTPWSTIREQSLADPPSGGPQRCLPETTISTRPTGSRLTESKDQKYVIVLSVLECEIDRTNATLHLTCTWPSYCIESPKKSSDRQDRIADAMRSQGVDRANNVT